MRVRKQKGTVEKLLAYETLVINGKLEQKNSTNTLKDQNETNQDFFRLDNRVVVQDKIYNNILSFRGHWKKHFNNDNPIHLEIGSGRGKFITTLAKENPSINYISIEMKEDIFISAVKKADSEGLKNIFFIWGSVELLDYYFDDSELDRIYINFCDPWPKKRYAKRRLTHRAFLELYNKKLDDGEIFFKTDNRDLFQFSLNEFLDQKWNLKNISLNLAHDTEIKNITTEYEDYFTNLGMPIYRLEASK